MAVSAYALFYLTSSKAHGFASPHFYGFAFDIISHKYHRQNLQRSSGLFLQIFLLQDNSTIIVATSITLTYKIVINERSIKWIRSDLEKRADALEEFSRG